MPCLTHPKYKGKGRPTSDCIVCLEMFCKAHPLKSPPAATLYVVKVFSGKQLVYLQAVENARVSVEKL